VGACDLRRKPLARGYVLEVLDRTLKMRQFESRAEEHKRLRERRALGLEQNLAELHQQTALLRLLQDIAVSANEATNIQEALQASLDRLCAHTHWPVGHAYVVADTATGALRPM